MRTLWQKLRWLALALALLGGCKTADPVVEPPKRVEEYTLPPESEARFNKPMTFPDGTPRAAKLNRSGANPNAPLSDPMRFQGGRPGGMGQY